MNYIRFDSTNLADMNDENGKVKLRSFQRASHFLAVTWIGLLRQIHIFFSMGFGTL